MEHAIRTLHDYFPSGTFQTMTTDCGKEFSCHERIQHSLGIPMYFADPYSSWQRGSNENANGLLREFFPKGTNFGMINPTELSLEHSEIILRPDLAEKLHHLRDGIDVLTRQSSESIREQRLHPVFRCTLISIHSSPSIDHRVPWCLFYYTRQAAADFIGLKKARPKSRTSNNVRREIRYRTKDGASNTLFRQRMSFLSHFSQVRL